MTDQHIKTLTEELRDDPELRRETEREWFIDGAIIQIEQAMERKGITRKELADRLGCSAPNVTQLLRHGSNLTLGKLMDIALAIEHRFIAPELVPLSHAPPWEPCHATPVTFGERSWVSVGQGSTCAPVVWDIGQAPRPQVGPYDDIHDSSICEANAH